jgi:hypothetical protein
MRFLDTYIAIGSPFRVEAERWAATSAVTNACRAMATPDAWRRRRMMPGGSYDPRATLSPTDADRAAALRRISEERYQRFIPRRAASYGARSRWRRQCKGPTRATALGYSTRRARENEHGRGLKIPYSRQGGTSITSARLKPSFYSLTAVAGQVSTKRDSQRQINIFARGLRFAPAGSLWTFQVRQMGDKAGRKKQGTYMTIK